MILNLWNQNLLKTSNIKTNLILNVKIYSDCNSININ